MDSDQGREGEAAGERWQLATERERERARFEGVDEREQL